MKRARPASTAALDAGSAEPSRLAMPTSDTSATSTTLSSAIVIDAVASAPVRTSSPGYSSVFALAATNSSAPTDRTSTVPVTAVSTAAGPSPCSCATAPASTPAPAVVSAALSGLAAGVCPAAGARATFAAGSLALSDLPQAPAPATTASNVIIRCP